MIQRNFWRYSGNLARCSSRIMFEEWRSWRVTRDRRRGGRSQAVFLPVLGKYLPTGKRRNFCLLWPQRNGTRICGGGGHHGGHRGFGSAQGHATCNIYTFVYNFHLGDLLEVTLRKEARLKLRHLLNAIFMAGNCWRCSGAARGKEVVHSHFVRA